MEREGFPFSFLRRSFLFSFSCAFIVRFRRFRFPGRFSISKGEVTLRAVVVGDDYSGNRDGSHQHDTSQYRHPSPL
ncbi:hypothetical protein ALI44B_09225 [Leifsonia sp. ALI-44-B]|nr:hypothetical protein ALI44B_09225 [Leifsonia sp. ALI-44-B]